MPELTPIAASHNPHTFPHLFVQRDELDFRSSNFSQAIAGIRLPHTQTIKILQKMEELSVQDNDLRSNLGSATSNRQLIVQGEQLDRDREVMDRVNLKQVPPVESAGYTSNNESGDMIEPFKRSPVKDAPS